MSKKGETYLRKFDDKNYQVILVLSEPFLGDRPGLCDNQSGERIRALVYRTVDNTRQEQDVVITKFSGFCDFEEQQDEYTYIKHISNADKRILKKFIVNMFNGIRRENEIS
jgi:hypothetical protein